MVRLSRIVILIVFEVAIAPLLVVVALISRFLPKAKVVGLGPEPLINNIYHAKSLRHFGWSVETFVDNVYFITSDFDVKLFYRNKFFSLLSKAFCVSFFFIVCRYKMIYIYFNGGGLYHTQLLWIIEPILYKIAGVKVLVMPYGSDIQDMQRCTNLAFKNAIDKDYPSHYRRRYIIRMKVWLWSIFADHIIAGCDWVDYMYHWDTLCLSHFSIDQNADDSYAFSEFNIKDSLRILHAPNHREIKGTSFFQDAVDKLRSEGLNIELILAQGIPNNKLRRLMMECDIIADQLIIGWYAMFAIEAMAMGKPVLCYLRQDLLDLYFTAGLLEIGEIPLINCNPQTVIDVIRDLASWPKGKLAQYGTRGRKYVAKHHSIESIGRMFTAINVSLGLEVS
jgi:hypothetical protein